MESLFPSTINPAYPDGRHPHLGEARHQRLDDRGRYRRWQAAALGLEEREGHVRIVVPWLLNY